LVALEECVGLAFGCISKPYIALRKGRETLILSTCGVKQDILWKLLGDGKDYGHKDW
jgi:hypothetical protein